MDKKGFLQISFQWLFAIIVGAFILFLAIYAVTKFSSTNQSISGTELNAQLSAIMNPLESSFETGKITPLNLGVETRIYPICHGEPDFGSQVIETSQKSFSKWSNSGISSKTKNKYLFFNSPIQGKNFYIFSKPFEFPFKITDLRYIISTEDNYCFVNAPSDIEEEITQLKPQTIFIEDCPENSVEVCFNRVGCDVNVNINSKTIEKNNSVVYFETEALMYAGIFSSKLYYECQVKRLMYRGKILTEIYLGKSDIIMKQGCNPEFRGDLNILTGLLGNYRDSSDLQGISSITEILESKNKNSGCSLW